MLNGNGLIKTGTLTSRSWSRSDRGVTSRSSIIQMLPRAQPYLLYNAHQPTWGKFSCRVCEVFVQIKVRNYNFVPFARRVKPCLSTVVFTQIFEWWSKKYVAQNSWWFPWVLHFFPDYITVVFAYILAKNHGILFFIVIYTRHTSRVILVRRYKWTSSMIIFQFYITKSKNYGHYSTAKHKQPRNL